VLVEWPLIGRRSELAQIADLLAREDVRGIVLAGTSGVGKTRLADECLRLAVEAGFATARIHATRSAASIPLGVLAPLLPSVRSAGLADLLAEARAVLERAAGGRPFLLVVDDAHLLDEASATLIHQVAVGASVFVVATVRTGEPVPDAIVALWKDGHAERIDLSPLDATACDQLVTAVLGGAVDGGSLQALWRASEGNPLVLRELLIGAREADRLESVGGVWRLRGAPAPSARLLELIQARLGGLDSTHRQALELIALGEPVPVAVLEACVGLTPLAALEESGLIRVTETRHRADVTLVHPLHGEVLRDAMPPLRGRMLRRQLADTTEATGARRREDLMRIAMWRIESGSPGDPAMLTSAAREALSSTQAEGRRPGCSSARSCARAGNVKRASKSWRMRASRRRPQTSTTATACAPSSRSRAPTTSSGASAVTTTRWPSSKPPKRVSPIRGLWRSSPHSGPRSC
jgi:hypothetical protein